MAFPSVTIPSLTNASSGDLYLDDFQTAVYSSAVGIGSIAGSVFSGGLMVCMGHCLVLLSMIPLLLILWLTFAFSKSVVILLSLRVLHGLVSSIVAMVATNYVVEIAHASMRGRLHGILEVARQVGFCFIYLLGNSNLSWRQLSLVCGGVTSMIPFFGFFLLPNSPRWLVTKSKHEATRQALVFYRGRDFDVDGEHRAIVEQLTKNQDAGSVGSQLKLLCERSVIRRMIILGFLLFGSQFAGNIALAVHSVTIFQSMNTGISEYLSTSLLSVMRVAGTVIFLLFADRFGRRQLILPSVVVTTACLATIGVWFLLQEMGYAFSELSWLPVVVILIYMLFLCIEIPIFMLLSRELLPTHVRSIGVSLLYILLYCGYFSVSFSYVLLISCLGSSGTFWLYTGLSVSMVFVVFFAVPETRNKSLEEIEEMFKTDKK